MSVGKTKSKNYARMKQLLDEPEVRTWRAIMEAFQLTFVQLQKGLMEEGLHVSRFQILFYLYFEGSMSAVDLSRKLLVTRGNVSTFIKRLEKDSQISVCPTSTSMSRPLYRLTENAEKWFEEIFPRHIRRVKLLVPSLPGNTLSTLKKIGRKES